jgi:hypothetical protein
LAAGAAETGAGQRVEQDAEPPGFALAWAALPKRAGSNPRRRALHAYRARLREGRPAEALLAGAQRYRAFCDATRKTGTEYVMQGARFFGPDTPCLDEWTLPVEAPRPAGGRDTAGRDVAIASLEAARDLTDADVAALLAGYPPGYRPPLCLERPA